MTEFFDMASQVLGLAVVAWTAAWVGEKAFLWAREWLPSYEEDDVE